MNKKGTKKDYRYAFEKGWSQIIIRNEKTARAEIMELFGFSTIQAFRNRKAGKGVLEVHHYNGLVKIFEKYGITEIWGKV